MWGALPTTRVWKGLAQHGPEGWRPLAPLLLALQITQLWGTPAGLRRPPDPNQAAATG